MSVINTNISSLTAQRNLMQSQASLSTSMQRLSSGLRINSAKDDAAGLAISERMTTQIRGSNQAARNANDGISLAQTAEGDLAQIGNNLQRMRELAVQSANATNSTSDRAALDGEVQALSAEIDRAAQNSSFNGTKLLDGSFTAQKFQVGANNTANDSITIDQIASTRTGSLGASYSATVTSAAPANAGFAATDLTINGVAVGATTAAMDTKSSVGNAYSAIAKASAINALSTGVTASVNVNTKLGANQTAFTATTDDLALGDLKINGVNIGAVVGAGTAAAQGTALASAINLQSAATGVTASAATGGALTLTAADGRNIDVAFAGAGNTARTGLTAGTYSGTITLSSTSTTGFVLADGGSTTGAANLGVTMGSKAATQTGTALSVIDINTVSGAKAAIDSIDSALKSVNSSRASLGAYQNRFASVVTSLQTTGENLSASRSRIQDADFAAETANLSRAQVLQQAGTAMVAQANQLPQGVLALLR
jgi:flagellin